MDFSELYKKRRSVRRFKDAPVTNEQISRLLEYAVMAPSACNMQSWHFYVVTDNKIKNELAENGAFTPWVATAPVVFVIAADLGSDLCRRFGDRAEELFVLQDTALAAQNILLGAADMGLGGCFVGAFNEDKLKAMLEMKEIHRPVIVIPVGVPAEDMPVRARDPIANKTTFVGDCAEYNPIDTNFRNFEIKNASANGSVIEDCKMNGSKFKNVELRDSTFESVDLRGTTLDGINVLDAIEYYKENHK
jgi:nitroreductase